MRLQLRTKLGLWSLRAVVLASLRTTLHSNIGLGRPEGPRRRVVLYIVWTLKAARKRRKGTITECAATPLRAVGFAHGIMSCGGRGQYRRDRPHIFYDFYHRRAVYFARGSYVFGAGEK